MALGTRDPGIKSVIKTLRFALILGLLIAISSCSKKKEPYEAQDLESIRASLREQVASGELTREEAVVRLAEANKEATLGSKQEKEDSKLSPELEALGQELKEKVAKGEMTDEEATAAWFKAAGMTKSSVETKGSKDSEKDKK